MKDQFLLQPLQPKIRFRDVLFAERLLLPSVTKGEYYIPSHQKFEYFASFTENSMILGFFFVATVIARWRTVVVR